MECPALAEAMMFVQTLHWAKKSCLGSTCAEQVPELDRCLPNLWLVSWLASTDIH